MSRCGTPSAYTQGCRCAGCRVAHSAYITEGRRRKRAGITRLVPVDAARAHILQLSEQGVGGLSVVKATGLSLRTIQFIRTGEQKKIRATMEAKILAVSEGDKTLYIRDRAAWWRRERQRTASFVSPLTGCPAWSHQ